MAGARGGRALRPRPRSRRLPQAGLLLLLGLVLLLVGSACSNSGSASKSDAGPAATADPDAPDPYRTVLSLIDTLSRCDVDHRGLLLDMGAGALEGRFDHQLTVPNAIVESTHDGATWARIYDRSVELRFVLPRATRVFTSLRAIGHDSRRATIIIDDFVMGHLSLKTGEAHTYTTRTSGLPLDAGEHVVKLRFRGYKRSDSEPFAEVDWIRIGIPDTIERTYSPPTMFDVITPSAQLANVPHRSLALRAPSTLRCTLRVPAYAQLHAHIGFSGTGSGLAELVARLPDGDIQVIERVEVKGGDTAEWSDVAASLHALAGQIITLELRVQRTSGGGRLLVGDPQIVVPVRPEPKLQPAQRVLVVLLDGVSRDELPPWSDQPTPHLPTLNRLAKTATVFDNHRASSSLVAAATASALSGLSVWQHNLIDAGARLPERAATIGQRAGQASVRAALFTSVPLSFEAFGFGGRWDTFEAYSPSGGALVSEPFDAAREWLIKFDPSNPRKMLAVVHARGGHPPWEVTPKEARELPPDSYTGNISPRRAAQQIHELDGRHSRLSEADRTHMRALFMVSLSKQDAALGKLIASLEADELWDDTLLIVSGEVASARDELFVDGGDLDERVLTLPLYVHFPQGKRSPQRVDSPTELMDVAHTALLALGVQPPAESQAQHLEQVAASYPDQPRRMRVAITEDRYSIRWGDYVLLGSKDKRPKLCAVALDPTCAYDRAYRYPLIADTMIRELALLYGANQDAPPRDPLRMDTATAGMLAVWGAN